MNRLLAGLLIFAACSLSSRARGGECPSALAPAAHVSAARQTLLALPLTDQSDGVPQPSQQAVSAMKVALDDFIGAQLHCSDARIEAQALQEALESATHATSDEDSEGDIQSPDAGHYGYVLKFDVKRWPANPKLLGVVASFSIECGTDALLAIYDASSGNWQEVMRWESAPYSKVSGAFGSFDYEISPPDAAGRWYALAKRIPPWCSSTWAALDYAVLRPQAGSAAPRVIFSALSPMWWGGDDFGELTANANDFEVRFHGNSKDHDLLVRPYVERFAIRGDAVNERLAPVALSPLDFVDEWLREPWDEAVRWTDPKAKAQPQVRELHERWHAEDSLRYETVRRCEGARRYEVAVVQDAGAAKAVFAVGVEGNFTLLAASRSAPLCKGADLALR